MEKYKEHAMQWVADNLVLERFKADIEGVQDWYEVEGNNNLEESCIMFLVDASYGHTIMNRVCEMFDIPNAPEEDDMEFDFWDTLDNYMSAIADELKRVSECEHDLFFSFTENGDYALLMIRESGDSYEFYEGNEESKTCECGRKMVYRSYSYGEDADGNRGIQAEGWFCRTCD